MVSRLSNRWRVVLQLLFVLAFCAGAVLLLVSMGLMESPADSHRVEFRVEARGGVAIITLDAGSASIPKPTTVSVPWSKSLRIPSGTEVYLTASNPTQTGDLTCAILLDKKVWKTATTSAPKDGVACAGIIP
ncbi:hypothetical protein FBQ81_03830 [Chloroflexi bacterium CFX6]|nr:hypothetical protein [Chloroflexi bacterium CFX6]